MHSRAIITGLTQAVPSAQQCCQNRRLSRSWASQVQPVWAISGQGEGGTGWGVLGREWTCLRLHPKPHLRHRLGLPPQCQKGQMPEKEGISVERVKKRDCWSSITATLKPWASPSFPMAYHTKCQDVWGRTGSIKDTHIYQLCLWLREGTFTAQSLEKAHIFCANPGVLQTHHKVCLRWFWRRLSQCTGSVKPTAAPHHQETVSKCWPAGEGGWGGKAD